MQNFTSKDYHIELMSLFEFANSSLSTGRISAKAGKELQALFKRVILGADIKPFMSLADKANDPKNYEKYYRLASEVNEPMLSDLFEDNGDLYDLMILLNISKDYLDFNDFKMLFLLKVSEIESNISLLLEEFLHFQLFDNFLGNIDRFDSFCHHLTANDGFCQLSPFSIKTIINWCDHYRNNTNRNLVNKEETRLENTILEETAIVERKDNSIEENTIAFTENRDNDNNTSIANNDGIASFVLKEPYEIKGRFTIEQIRHFFSFLYQETNRSREPYLDKNSVDEIFKDGLVIPVNPREPRFKLNVNTLSPRKIIDCAFHEFFSKNSLTLRDKANYFRFFGSYIEDYKKALGTNSERENFLSNINGEKSRKRKVNLEDYLPKP